ncbi:hypothetical protein [Brucella rhizosphaerae]|uniref:hypothetical protein n=1 Tax=Brucella rhizosphaerae TaxID=571254 RepID=UPI000464EB2D|nr:hypothetical protein [Brucella rhizosphaerae]
MTKPIKKRLPPAAGKGRPKGAVNKTTALLKDAILTAATQAGDKTGKDGLVSYLTQQAEENPVAFMGLLGKVLPLQIAGDPNQPLETITRIELVPFYGDDQGGEK